MKAYVVTTGRYSDYRILMIFTDREKAELYVDTYNKSSYMSDASIEVWNTADDYIVGMEDYDYYLISDNIDGKYNNGNPCFTKLDDDIEYLHDDDLAQRNVFYKLNDVLEVHRKFRKGTDEEFIKKKMEKILHDIRPIVKQMLADGATIEDINDAIGGFGE